MPTVYSMGLKHLALQGTEEEEYQLKTKIKNMQELIGMQRVKQYGAMSKATWCSEINKAEVVEKSGSHWNVMGHCDGSKLYLYPEEALFLIDVGALELTWHGVPLSLQRAYSLLLNTTSVTCNQYRVYSHLSLLGYNVQRHSKKKILTKYEKGIEVHKVGLKLKDCPEVSFKKMKFDMHPAEIAEERAVISQLHINPKKSDKEILAQLRVISPAKLEDTDNDVENIICYDLHDNRKGGFKKSALQLPIYRIAIVSANDQIPDIAAVAALNEHHADGVPIVYAVVYPDFVQFMQMGPVTLPVIL